MNRKRKIVLWAGVAVASGVLILLLTLSRKEKPVTLTGVVIRQDSDPRKQVPITGVEITAANGVALRDGISDSSGLFHLSLLPGLKKDQPILLMFRHPDYKPLNLSQPFEKKMLYVVRMSPIAEYCKGRAQRTYEVHCSSINQVFREDVDRRGNWERHEDL